MKTLKDLENGTQLKNNTTGSILTITRITDKNISVAINSDKFTYKANKNVMTKMTQKISDLLESINAGRLEII